MKRKPIERDSRAVLRLVELIHTNPGKTMRELVVISGYSISHTKNALSCISGFNLAAPVYVDGGVVGWFPLDIARVKQAEWVNVHERRRIEAQKRREDRAATLALAKQEKARQEAEKRAQMPPTMRSRILDMAKQPEGVSTAQMLEALRVKLNSVGKHCRKMEEQGRLFRADRRGARLRWFDTAEKAKEWETLPPMEPSEWLEPGLKAWANNPDRPRSQKEQAREAARQAREQRQRDRLVAIGERIKNSARQPSRPPPKLAGSDQGKYAVIKAKPGIPAAVVIRESKAPQEVDYSRAKIIRDDAPKYDHRYQLPPGAVVVGEFSRQWQQLRGQA